MDPEIISNLITVSPVVAVLVWVVIHFRGELKDKNDEIKALNVELRSSEKEAISVITKLNETLKDLIVEIKNGN